MSTDHSELAPSSMARIVQCPGSVVMQRGLPDEDGPEALEGEAVHWGIVQDLTRAPESGLGVGDIAPNGVAITDEMLERVEFASECLTDNYDVDGLNLEQRNDIPRVHPKCFGTPDAWRWIVYCGRLRVSDYKDGFGKVDAYMNWQLMAYAAGLIPERIDDTKLVVEFEIIQPRDFGNPRKTWSVVASDLRGPINRMAMACEEALGEKPSTHVGPECKHCKARHICPTLASAAADACDVAGKAVPLQLTTAAAASEKRRIDYAIEQMQARSSGLEAQLLHALRTGEKVPHFHVEHGAGREQWSKPVDQILAMGELLGADLSKAGTVTPAQARKLGVDVPGFTTRATGEAKLVVDSPHRAARIFGGV